MIDWYELYSSLITMLKVEKKIKVHPVSLF